LLTMLRSLQRLLALFREKEIPYMIIGGYVLPFYGRIDTTIDLDLAVAIRTERELKQLCLWVESIDFEPRFTSFENPLILIFDRKEKVEIELWHRPDGIVFDDETLKRRRKVKMDSIQTWIISPEDFIVNKLARSDRGANDEQDVKSVLVRQEGRLDEEYLRRRAAEAKVVTILDKIRAAV